MLEKGIITRKQILEFAACTGVIHGTFSHLVSQTCSARIIAIGDMASENHNYCLSKLQERTCYEYVNRIVSLYD